MTTLFQDSPRVAWWECQDHHRHLRFPGLVQRERDEEYVGLRETRQDHQERRGSQRGTDGRRVEETLREGERKG